MLRAGFIEFNRWRDVLQSGAIPSPRGRVCQRRVRFWRLHTVGIQIINTNKMMIDTTYMAIVWCTNVNNIDILEIKMAIMSQIPVV